MARLDRAGFEPALLELVGNWLPSDRQIPVIACGMIGARQGWIEVPYRRTPCKPVLVEPVGRPDTIDPRLKVMVLAGIKQIDPAPDVMRGEETQIAGVLSQNPRFEGVLCLPGTHTKWVWINAAAPAQPRALIGGHMVSTLVGLLVVKTCGPAVWAAALAVGIAMIAMHLTGTFHPPAGIDPLVVVSNNMSWSFLTSPRVKTHQRF